MPHGNRDYFSSIPLSTLYGLVDMAELAARIGSIDTFDRAGNVLWFTGFEEGMSEFEIAGNSAGLYASISTDRSFSGGYSCKLTPGTSPPYDIFIYRLHFLPNTSKVGIEFSFRPSNYIDKLYSQMSFFKDNKTHYCRIRYNNVDKSIEYWSHTNTYVPVITDINLAGKNRFWSIMKWVYNIEEGEYDRLVVNSINVNMRGKKPVIVSAQSEDFMYYDIGLYQANGGQDPTYIDNVILTINE